MKILTRGAILAFALAASSFAPITTNTAAAGVLSEIDIAYDKFILDNGLTVIVHEDRSLPEVKVEVVYRVGSRDEKPGKTGFAHLFEHLMFNGSENFDRDYFDGLQPFGARLNGTTNPDRTNYYQTVPTNVLERALWLESDRMGHMLGAVTQEKLDEQRGVVQNEKRQRYGAPFGYLQERIARALYPTGHPYSWTTIGSMEDLNAASLEDVKSWFREYYGPTNAYLLLAGDVDVGTAKTLANKYFGDIPPGRPVKRTDDLVPARLINTSEIIEDDQAKSVKLNRYWVIPGGDQREGHLFSGIAEMLSDRASSWLHKTLVEEKQVATSAGASAYASDLAGLFYVFVDVKDGVSVDAARAAVEEVLQRFFKQGPTKEELELKKAADAASIISQLEGYNSRASWLSYGERLEKDPEFYKTILAWEEQATAEDLRQIAKKWLTRGHHEILITPFSKRTAAAEGADRSAPPMPVGDLPIRALNIADAVLDNGVKLRFVESNTAPLLKLNLVFEGGTNRLSTADKAGAALYSGLLGTKTKSRSEEDIINEGKRLGAQFGASVGGDNTVISASLLKANAEEGLELLTDTLFNAEFDSERFQQDKTKRITGLKESLTSLSVGGINSPRVLYGADHPYSNSTLAELEAVEVDDVADFHETWIKPEYLTILASGDMQLSEARELLNDAFGKWKTGASPLPELDIPLVERPQKSRVVLFDSPAAVQTSISAVQVFPGSKELNTEEYTRRLAAKAFGGYFGSRINSNLREDKGWSYGIRGSLSSSQNPRTWSVGGNVQTDKTKESLIEFVKELEAYGGDRPFTSEELEVLRSSDIRSLPSAIGGTTNAYLGYMRTLYDKGFADDYIQGLPEVYNGATVEAVQQAWQDEYDLDRITWIISGDLEKIEDDVRALDLGDVEVWDSSGKRIR